ncbi:MAG: thiamine pyrophosphate-binding protein, partial [Negativicutes bacterium]|nr:thiamine pyrophosphate-binding protein [Negativicutes bacterium]
MIMTGAQAIIACLKEQGVDVVFGYPGGQNLPLYDAIYDAPLRHVLTAHEQGAVHAADGYARATGKPGVCFTITGPGLLNILTPLG